jgi:hypothetical protein
MARYSAAATQTTARTSLRGPTLAAAAAVGFRLKEVGVFATTAVATNQVALRKTTAVGTAGTALDEVPWFENSAAASCTATQAPITDHTAVAGSVRLVHMPEMIGGGYIWTFGPEGLIIPEGTGNAVFLSLPAGTDGLIDFYFDWEE